MNGIVIYIDVKYDRNPELSVFILKFHNLQYFENAISFLCFFFSLCGNLSIYFSKQEIKKNIYIRKMKQEMFRGIDCFAMFYAGIQCINY